MKDIAIKTALSEGQYSAMKKVVEARGFSEAGYVRHLILSDIAATEDLVLQMQRLTGSPESVTK